VISGRNEYGGEEYPSEIGKALKSARLERSFKIDADIINNGSETLGRKERTMIEGVQVVSVPVSDQDRAKTFYTDTLGFELRTENAFSEDMRWIEVILKGSTISLSLVTWFEAMPPGSLQGLVFAVDDVHATHDELLAKGVTFDFAPREMPGGLQAVFRDPDGNGFVIAER
jgi:catechol 2,3-dioxygenase-like lactoylglutathione lyase family enzyme